MPLFITGCVISPGKSLGDITQQFSSKSFDELAQRFAGKNYNIEPIEDEDDQYKITVYNSDVRKRRKKRQSAMSDVCSYSKIARVLAEKDDHKLGKTQLIVWCETK